MQKFRRVAAFLAAAASLILYSPTVTNGMESPSAGAECTQNTSAWELTSNEMTARNTEYEHLGGKVMEALKTAVVSNGYIQTEVRFDSVEAARLFGKYFYRYIYLGKEPITLHAAECGDNYYIYLTCRSPERAAQQHDQVRDKLAQIVDGVLGMDDREKAEYFYSWVFNNVSYDHTLQNTTVYDAVMEGNAVCWGYVGTYLSLCRSAGLVCEPVYRGSHAWNRVWIEGEWKYCDITWDKSLGGSLYRFMTQQEMDSDPMHNAL